MIPPRVLAGFSTLPCDLVGLCRPHSWEQLVWHVVTHEQYHRGQVFTRLALLGRRDLPDHDLLR